MVLLGGEDTPRCFAVSSLSDDPDFDYSNSCFLDIETGFDVFPLVQLEVLQDELR
jgi:hypothetical protein